MERDGVSKEVNEGKKRGNIKDVVSSLRRARRFVVESRANESSGEMEVRPVVDRVQDVQVSSSVRVKRFKIFKFLMDSSCYVGFLIELSFL